MDIFEVLQSSVDYLKENDNDLWEFFITASVTEEMIPDTYKAIKKYVLKFYNTVDSSNKTIRLIKIPLLKRVSPMVNNDKIEPLLDYFKQEKESLISLKKFLNSNYKLPLASYTGIFATAIIEIHTKNSDKLNKIIDIAKLSSESNFNVQLPDNCLTPTNQELVCNIHETINKILIKK